MSDETILRARQNCCRLCLAPDSECISILNSYAADKEPLATKIQSCVNIKISPIDRLSLRICHACISYLNSWQSFKNRCIASQSKQRNWLDFGKQHDNNIANIGGLLSGNHGLKIKPQHPDDRQHEKQIDHQQESTLATSILDGISSLKKRKSLTVYPIPVQIKDEPMEDDFDVMKHQHDESDDIDPTLFLERNEDESSEPHLQKEQHLASLGLLKHADPSAANQHHLSGFMESNYSYDGHLSSGDLQDKSIDTVAATNEVKEASCRACNLKFSTRANARRHERNLHPNLFVLSSSTSNSTPRTTPTAALTALQLKRKQQGAASSMALIAGQQQPLGLFDYDNPEKYQHLLTEEKIAFMQHNDDFLQQYQTMTCNCCLRTHATYKTFMAHMRKKYHTLPRNLCFKCLKQNDSKALFISHLKKRNCINLYKIYHGCLKKLGDSQSSPDKLRAKELLVNKIYECKICSKHFRLKLEFRSHVYEEHADAQKKDVSPGHCGFCGLEIEDPFERKRHYNNMDCIVILRCITCDEKFDNHQKFLDHVYSKHLGNNNEQQKGNLMREIAASLAGTGAAGGAGGGGGGGECINKKQIIGSSGAASLSIDDHRNVAKPQFFSRLPQSCTICGQHYNNYNNVLRHMESKHPDQLPQTYKCIKCHVGYPRLMNLREHMIEVHGMKIEKARNNSFDYFVDSPALAGSAKSSDAYTGRYDYVMKDLLSITNGGTMGAGNDRSVNDDEDDMKSESPVPRKVRIIESNNSSLKECPICSAVFNNNIGLSNHMRSHASAAEAANTSKAHLESGNNAVANDRKAAIQMNTAVFKRSLELAADRRFRRMRCRICQKRFSSKKSYRRHMLVDHQIRNVQFIKCKLCDAEFAYEKGLKVHMFKIHNTLLKEEMIVKQYECDICSIVYRTEDQLLLHKRTIHGNDNAQMSSAPAVAPPIEPNADTAPLYWYQCKYCPSNFNTNKKLAIHINSHEEFDSNDYSCKDCGNVYSGRKSLWVHRYKKHPPVADPSECNLCRKVFFDKQMLQNHTPICNRKPVPIAAQSSSMAAGTTDGSFYKHKTGDDDDVMDTHDVDTIEKRQSDDRSSLGGSVAIPTHLKIKLPEVACTICGQKFTDQELFAKHIQIHEMELYTDNPLAAMFDTGPADPNQFYLDRVNDNGEYACDICPKAFAQMTALKVHRKWHFRGDSKQIPTEVNSVLASSVALQPPAAIASKSLKRRRELKCDYCPSTFISSNNLRRHIAELHKSELSNWPEPPRIEPEKYLHCAKCDIKFESKREWIDHKVGEAKIMKPFGPFQWGCDICGEYVSRKEKLIHHILAHMKERSSVTTTGEQEYYPGESNSQDSMLSSGHRVGSGDVDSGNAKGVREHQQQRPDEEYDGPDEEDEEEEEEEEDEEEVDEDERDDEDDDEGEGVTRAGQNANDAIANDNQEIEEDMEDEDDMDDNDDRRRRHALNENSGNHSIKAKRKSSNHQTGSDASSTEAEDSPSYIGEDDEEEEEEEEDDENEDDEEDDYDPNPSNRIQSEETKKRYACDLCRVFFETSQELQKHVTSHFLNGPGAVTLSEINTKNKPQSVPEKSSKESASSRSSSDDVASDTPA